MGGEVLATDIRERVVVDAVVDVGPQQASPRRRIEGGRRVPIVHDEDETPLETPCRVADPCIEGETDLCPLAGGEADALAFKPTAEAPGSRPGRRR